MKFKKLLLVLVVMVLSVTLLAGTAMAGQGKNDKWKDDKGKGFQIKNVQVKQIQVKKGHFKDVSDKHWGNKRIRAMVLQGVITGYGNGLFCPNASVSKIEALAMILRMEEVDKEDLKEALEDQDVPKSIPFWAKGYAALAVEEGILTEKELKKFQPMSAAKRYEVAIYLGRALDIDEDGDEDDLDFKDVKSIPDEAMKYLPYLCEQEYFTGYKNGKFMPNKPVTRAEMASILSKVAADEADDDDIEVDIIDQFKAKGKIVDLDDNELVLKVNSKEKEFSVDSEDIIVFLDNKEADYDDLKEGYTALVLCNSDKEALVVYARSADVDEDEDEDEDEEVDVDEVDGIFQEIDGDEIVIKVGSSIKDYELDDDVDVEIDGDNADLDDLLFGMKVELEIEDGEVVAINADSLEEIKGVFQEIDGDEIVVKVGSSIRDYELEDDVDVEIDGDNADLDDLLSGMKVELDFEDGEVVAIDADSLDKISGEFKDIDGDEIVIEVDGEDFTYSLDNDVEVEIDNEEEALEDLVEGMDVELTFDDGEVVEIDAES